MNRQALVPRLLEAIQIKNAKLAAGSRIEELQFWIPLGFANFAFLICIASSKLTVVFLAINMGFVDQ